MFINTTTLALCSITLSILCLSGCFGERDGDSSERGGKDDSSETGPEIYEQLSPEVMVTTLNEEDILIVGKIAKLQGTIYMGCTFILDRTSSKDGGHELTINLLKRQERREAIFMDLIALKHAPLPRKIEGDKIEPYDDLVKKWSEGSDKSELIVNFHQEVHVKLYDLLEASKAIVTDPELNKIIIDFLTETKLIVINFDVGQNLE